MREIEVLMLKEYLQIGEQYAKYSHFKEKVINIVHNEINKNTDISFTFEEIKKGRKVDKIKFYITANKKENEEKNSSKLKKLKKVLELVPKWQSGKMVKQKDTSKLTN